MSTEAASTKSISSKEEQPPSANVEDEQQPQNGTAEQQKQGEDEGAPTEPDGGYPPQKHAGAIGLGPEYGQMRRTVRVPRIYPPE